jgi:hypothetical protein
MKVREILKIQQAFENKTIPYDLLEEENYYWSESKKEYIKILDLDLHHLIRIVIKGLEGADNRSNKIDVLNAISIILMQTEEIRKKLYEQT